MKFLVSKLQYGLIQYPLPPKCIAESFTTNSSVIFSSLQLTKDLLYFCINSTFFTGGIHFGLVFNRQVLRLATFCPLKKQGFFPIYVFKPVCILLRVIRYSHFRGRSNSLCFIWYHFKIFICQNFDIRNRNGEISLENQYDSAKIGISARIWRPDPAAPLI